MTVAAKDSANESQTLYYVVSVREPYTDPDVHDGSDFFFVFYVNTKDYQPLLAQDYILEKYSMMGGVVVE